MKIRSVAVIGLGTFGYSLAHQLAKLGDRVLAIDVNETPVSLVCEIIDEAVQADATDINVLDELGLKDYDAAVVCIGKNFEVSVVIAMHLIEINGPSIWVKAQDAMQVKILKAIGVRNILQPEVAYGNHLAYLLHNPVILDYVGLGEDQYIVKVAVKESSVGQTLVSCFGINDFVSCVGVFRKDRLLTESPCDIVLEALDQILLFGSREQLSTYTDKMQKASL